MTTAEQSMIERAARAIFDTAVAQRPLSPIGIELDWPSWEEAGEEDRRHAMAEARAAVKALREPSPDILIKAGIAIGEERPHAHTYVDEAAACIRAAIDAILNEETVT